MRVLLDTCVVIDVLQGREPFCKEGQQLFLAAANDLFAGCITAKAATDIYYLTHRHTHSDKASREVLSKLFVLLKCWTAPVSTAAAPSLPPFPILKTPSWRKRRCGRGGLHRYPHLADFAKAPLLVLSPKEFLQKVLHE